MSTLSHHPWRIIAAEIIAAMKADPDSLRSIYDDREFRPGRNASVWAQLSARLAQARKAYREAVAKGCLKEVQHTMLRRCFAHDYTQPGSYMITLVVPDRGSNPFGTVKGSVRKEAAATPPPAATLAASGSLAVAAAATPPTAARKGITLTPAEASAYALFSYAEGPLRMELTPLGAAVLEALGGISANYPMVEVRKAQLMPDHLHAILVVHAPIISSKGTPRHLGHVIAGYKKGCNRAYWQLTSAGKPLSTAPLASSHALPCSTGGQPGSHALPCSSLQPSSHALPCATGGQPSSHALPCSTGGQPGSHALTCSSLQPGSSAQLAPGADAAASGEGAGRFSRPVKVPSGASTGRPSLWAEGYTDTIILSNQHMDTEEAYLDDNIFRLRMKQEHRDLLRTVLHIRINGHDFAALGNINLLRRPWKEQVQYHHWEQDVPAGFLPCDRSWGCRHFYRPAGKPQDTAAAAPASATAMGAAPAAAASPATPAAATLAYYTLGEPIVGATEAEAHTERLLQAGDGGAVFASPFISETEKALRDAALTMGIPYIRLTREGFRDLYTPTKSEFEACCEGNLLILAPWEDRRRTATITRRECMALNGLAKMITNDDLDLLWLRNDSDTSLAITPREDE